MLVLFSNQSGEKMSHLSLCVYTVKTKLYKQSSGYSEVPYFMFASGNWDKMKTVGNEHRQKLIMKTRIRNTKLDFPVEHSFMAAVGN